jgi:hypothetical protein
MTAALLGMTGAAGLTVPAAAQPAPQPAPEKSIEASAATPTQAEPAVPEPEPAADAKPAEAQPSPTPSAEPAAAVSGDLRRIAVTSDPPGARLFWKGKEVGTTPFTLELRADEKHAYESGLPGYVTRKVVIDGSKSEVNIGMRPQAGPFTGSTSRK